MLLGLLSAASPTAATGHSEVIAQHIVSLHDGPYHWVAAPVPIAAEPTPGTVEEATFFVVLAGSATLADGDGVAQYELGAGEAAVLLPCDTYTQSASTTDPPAELWRIALAEGDASGGDNVGEAFMPGSGDHDLELIRDILWTNELLSLPASVAPALVQATGDVIVTSDATSLATELGAGQTQAFPGALTIANLGDEAVAVLAARVTPALGTGTNAEAPIESSAPVDSTPAGPAPSSTTTPATPTTSSSTPTPTSTTTPTSTPAPGDTLDPGAVNTTPSSFRDSDSDGLTDAEEATYGTNPNDSDTDGDLWSDGEEVAAYGTDPLDLSDRPFVDSDGDGVDDTSEYYNHTDPNDPLSHP